MYSMSSRVQIIAALNIERRIDSGFRIYRFGLLYYVFGAFSRGGSEMGILRTRREERQARKFSQRHSQLSARQLGWLGRNNRSLVGKFQNENFSFGRLHLLPIILYWLLGVTGY